jgi:hypothetical protein
MSKQNQKPMIIDEHEVLLSRVQQVDPPAFMLTRIEQSIKKSHDHNFSRKQLSLILMGFAIVFSINLISLKKHIITAKKSNNSIETLSKSMSLSTSNQLYNE